MEASIIRLIKAIREMDIVKERMKALTLEIEDYTNELERRIPGWQTKIPDRVVSTPAII